MSKTALTPDLARDIRNLTRRLDALEARLSGPRFYGPFVTSAITLGPGSVGTGTWTHNLNWTSGVVYGVVAAMIISSGSAVPRFAVASQTPNAVVFNVALGPSGGDVPGSVTFTIRGHVVIY